MANLIKGLYCRRVFFQYFLIDTEKIKANVIKTIIQQFQPIFRHAVARGPHTFGSENFLTNKHQLLNKP